jgi:hypothetical protein
MVRKLALALVAAAALGTTALAPTSASAWHGGGGGWHGGYHDYRHFGYGYGYGYSYGYSWCYYHPYACYRD